VIGRTPATATGSASPELRATVPATGTMTGQSTEPPGGKTPERNVATTQPATRVAPVPDIPSRVRRLRQTAVSSPPRQPEREPEPPSTRTVRKVVKATVSNHSTVPTASRSTVPTAQREGESQPRPVVEAELEVRVNPEQLPAQATGFRRLPPPVPEGMPEPKRGPDGQPLPLHMQDPGFPGHPGGRGPQGGSRAAPLGGEGSPPGYDNRRRRGTSDSP
jgi:hypothetical protein